MSRASTRRAPRLSELATVDRESKCINVIIETPKGARTKLAYDPEREAFVVKKVLPQGMSFPFDFGFIPSTQGQDGDPLDVLVLMDESVPSGSIVPSRLIGVLEATQTEKDGASERNDRLIAISQSCQLFAEVRKLADLPDAVIRQIEQFFISYNEQEGKEFEINGCYGRKRAEQVLNKGRRRRARLNGK
jgi:inorganic pyrophosphatase